MQELGTILTRALAPLVCALAMSVGLSAPARAQSAFSPAIRVNQGIITYFELEQRILLMTVLGIPGNPEVDAREALIEERLRQQVLDEAGFDIAPEDVQVGIDEIAARTELSTEQFLTALGEVGVWPETVRDFVEVQLAWRDYISVRFLSQARPTEAEVDRALGLAGTGGGIQVLLSEIIIPVTPQTIAQVQNLAQQIANVDGYDAFAAAAAQYSAADTRVDGGRLDWLAINSLPPGLQPVILEMDPGEITAPINLPNAVALFQMRGIREAVGGTPRYAAIEYAAYYLAGGRSPEALSAAAAIAGRIDTCDDLYGVARGQPAEALDRVTAKPSEIPQDIALELAKLDPGEVSTTLTRNNGQTLVFLMLCNRTAELGEDASREDVANALTQRRLAAFAQSLVEQLRAEAIIVEGDG